MVVTHHVTEILTFNSLQLHLHLDNFSTPTSNVQPANMKLVRYVALPANLPPLGANIEFSFLMKCANETVTIELKNGPSSNYPSLISLTQKPNLIDQQERFSTEP